VRREHEEAPEVSGLPLQPLTQRRHVNFHVGSVPVRKVENGIVVFAACVNVAIGVHTGGRVRAAPVLRPGTPGRARARAC